MQALEVLWLRWLLVMILVGLGLALALFLGFHMTARAGRPGEREEAESYPADISVASGRIPLILKLLYVAIFAFMIIYAVSAIWKKFSY